MGDMRDWPMSARAAAVALLAALALDVAAIVHARQLRRVNAEAPLVLPSTPRIAIVTPTDAELIRVAVNKSPFDVTPPAPASAPAAVARQSAPVMPTLPRLIGTVVQSNGGFVVLELPDQRMQVVRIGEQAAGFRLRSVTAGEAVFDDPRGVRVSLRTADFRP